jgi:hypothetical protein
MKKPLPVATRVYFEPRDRARVKAAAKAAGAPVSELIRRIVLDDLESHVFEERLLSSRAFRGAIAEAMSRPEVFTALASSMGKASPAQLELFKSNLDRTAKAWAKGIKAGG